MRQHILASLVFLSLTVSGQAANPFNAMQVGINVEAPRDYSVAQQFVDAMKQSRHWGSVNAPWDEAATVDSHGWPKQDASVVVLCCTVDSSGHSIFAGDYALSFTGKATVHVMLDAGSVSHQHYDTATNRTTATVTVNPSTTDTLVLLSFTATRRTPTSATGSGVTNVKLIRPRLAPNGQPWWTSQNQTFTTPFLALLKPFAALRFMDFAGTNNSTVVNWSDATTKASASQSTARGVAWDYAIELANTLNKDAWINIPDQATDDYVTRTAQLFAAKLKPGLHLYTEYSNEVWNFTFDQADRSVKTAVAEVTANPASSLAWNCAVKADCQYIWAERYVARRGMQIGKIFRTAFGSRAADVRPIYATQQGMTWYLGQSLPMLAKYYGPPSSLFYAVAQAPYWSGDNALTGRTPKQELDAAAANLPAMIPPAVAFSAWATDYGLKNVTYEGGPGMTGAASLSSKIAANRTKAMGDQVSTALTNAAESGVSLFMFYNSSGTYDQYGMWGATEDAFKRSTYKLTALKGAITAGGAPLKAGTTIPASLPALDPDITAGDYFSIPNPNGYVYLRKTADIAYLIDAPKAGTYDLRLTVGSYLTTTTTASIAIDRKSVGALTVPVTGGAITNWTKTAKLKLHLTQGLHVLHIAARKGEFAYRAIAVSTSP